LATGAELLANPNQLLSSRFPDAEIENVNVLLSRDQAERIQGDLAQALIDRVFTFFVARKAEKVIGYAGLYTRKIRSKDQTAIYFLSPSGSLESIELIAFYEPPEYKPKKKWLDKFRGSRDPRHLKLGGDIQVVSGATLTAQSFMLATKTILAVWQARFASEASAK